MKFSEMKYVRPDLEAVKAEMTALTERLRQAEDYASAKTAFLAWDALQKTVTTAQVLAHIRHTIDTCDTFYDEEMQFWNEQSPQLQEYGQAWVLSLLDSPYRADFAAE